MRSGIARILGLAVVALWLAGCSTTGTYPFGPAATSASTDPPSEPAFASASPPPLGAPAAAEPLLYGGDPNDDLSRGKLQYRAGNFGLAERHFRKAAESHPRDAEAWLGLAASYDQLRRFDLSDRAYAQAIRILGQTTEILNNQGYSYMLRGDYARAHATLLAAQRKDPGNKYIANNLRLLADAQATGKAIK